MSRSDWNILAAFAGLAALGIAFGLGIYVTALNQPEQWYPRYSYSNEQPRQSDPSRPDSTEISGARQYRTPCRDPQTEGESNLCAQWHSARAAEESAFWTKLAFCVGLFGLAGLYWQVVLTRRAVEDTSEATEAMIEANKISKDSAISQLRPYMHPEDLSYCLMEFPDGKFIVCNVIWRNGGSTPAVNIALRAGGIILPEPITEKIRIGEIAEPRPLHVSPNGTVRTIDIRIPFDDFSDIFNGIKHAYIYGTADYKNLMRSDDRHTTDFMWKISFICEVGHPASAEAIKEIRWVIEPFHNAIT
jgi:hypothetical protein